MDSTAENCPTWLNKLYGESPVLSAFEWRLLLKVRSIAQEEFGMSTSSVDGGKMSKDLSSLIDKLEVLVDQLKACEKSKRDFQKYYLRWEPIRNKNIKILKEIANELQKKKEETNNTKYAESFTSFVAGAISFAARRHPVAAVVAGGVALLCTVAAYGSSCQEAKLIEEKIKQVKDIVKDDKEHFEVIWSWLADSSDLRDSVDEIVAEMHRKEKKWENAEKEIKFFLFDKKERKETGQDMLIKNMLNCIKISSKFQDEISDVVTVIMAIIMVQKRNCSLLKLASSGVKIKTQLVDFARGLLLALDMPLKFTCFNGTKKSIVILRMVLDLAVLFDVSEEIQKGSPSKECETVKKIANILQNEANALRRMYYEIKGSTRYD